MTPTPTSDMDDAEDEPWGIRDDEMGFLRTFRTEYDRDQFYALAQNRYIKPVLFGPTPISEETAMDSKPVALEPCPFCRVALVPNNNQDDLYVRRYGTHYTHQNNGCLLDGNELTPSEVGAWNTRAAPPSDAAMTAESDTALLRQCLEALDWAEDSVPRDGYPRTKFINATLAKLRERLA